MDWEDFYNSFRKPGFVPGYEIQNRLGGGAFGDVYKARKQSIGKPYAIKFLKIEDDGQREAVERELAQVRHFAAIDHPNLVTIEDLGAVMGVPYLIMGYAGEDTLARRLKRGALDADAALLYFVQACRGVLALHDRRLVHFDLKPSNIFLKGDVARVGDYGLSKLLTDGRMTLSFGRGTPQYMAPEMLRNRADHRADVYSLGVILYESLTGELPFKSDETGGLVLRERDDPPPFQAGFPAALRGPAECCLRLDPGHRYSHVGELLEDLGQTARQGDSVRFDVDGSGAVAARDGAASDASAASPAPPESDRGELGEAVAGGRGVAGAARNVWEGLREATSEVQEASRKAARNVGQGLEAAQRGSQRVVRDARATLTSARRVRDEARTKAHEVLEAMRARKGRKPLEPGGPGAPGDLGAPRALAAAGAQRAAGGVQEAAGTVPVPPRVEGGPLATLLSTIVVGFEVLGSLVGGLARGSVRFLRGATDRLLRSSGGVVRSTVRLLVFVLLMAALGAVVMTLGLLFVNAVGG